MKPEEFQRLLTQYTKETQNVRACTKDWYSGICKVDDKIALEIGSIVSLLQHKVDNGYFCDKDSYLMIYNFQPLCIDIKAGIDLYSLDIVIRPIGKINNLESCDGIPLHLVVDGKKGELVNTRYAMNEMGIEDDSEDEGDPESYGSYLVYSEPKTLSFKERLNAVEITKVESKDLQDAFVISTGDSSVQKMMTFAYSNVSLSEPTSPVSPPSPSLLRTAELLESCSPKNPRFEIQSPVPCTV